MCAVRQESRKKLPIFKYREEILAAVKEHQVLVLSAETGSGEGTHRPGLTLLQRLMLQVPHGRTLTG